MHDLIIIGGGPGGTAAAVYAARKRLKSLLIVEKFGGQSDVSPDIQNWIGTVSISGSDLAEAFKKHVLAYKDDVLQVMEGERVIGIEKIEGGLRVKTNMDNHAFDTKTILITTGSSRRKLKTPGAEEFEGKGITYCATCDGPLFTGKKVAVIGGGNAGFETAAQLLAYTDSVTLLQFNDKYDADAITTQKVLSHPKMKGVLNTETVRIEGDTFVKSITYKDRASGAETTIPIEGVFVEIGQVPATGFVKDLVEMNKFGAIVIDPRTQKTSVQGIWAAGDCTDVLYHQNNIAAGDAVRALEDIYNYLHLQ